MNYHGLSSWDFEMREMKTYFGFCFYSKKLITLSSILASLNDESQVIDTLLHEIAHALAPKRAGHGKPWKTLASALGCPAVRCYDNTVARPAKKYVGECPRCHRLIYKHRRRFISCGKCNPKFDKTLLFTWKEA